MGISFTLNSNLRQTRAIRVQGPMIRQCKCLSPVVAVFVVVVVDDDVVVVVVDF